jgi:hypothetical protein
MGAGPSGYDPSLAHADHIAPTVSLTAPTSAATVSGPAVPMTAVAGDAGGVHHVDFLVDGAVVETDDIAPFTWNWDSTTIPDSTVDLTASAVDVVAGVSHR